MGEQNSKATDSGTLKLRAEHSGLALWLPRVAAGRQGPGLLQKFPGLSRTCHPFPLIETLLAVSGLPPVNHFYPEMVLLPGVFGVLMAAVGSLL